MIFHGVGENTDVYEFKINNAIINNNNLSHY